MKHLINTIVFVLLFITAKAQQQPIINTLSKTSGTVGETITITGSNFPTNIADIQVNFGAGIGTVTSALKNQLQVVVPNTATASEVAVLDKTTGLSAISPQQFFISYGGSTFETSQLDPRKEFPTGKQQIYDICTCDFDGDGLVDAAVSHHDGTDFSVFRNTSTLTTTSFDSTSYANGIETINTFCDDLNGDGKPDLVFSSNLSTAIHDVFVFRNNSKVGNIDFTNKDFSAKIPDQANGNNRNALKILTGDVDEDGKRDLVVGNTSDASIFIYRNITSSIGGAITFDNPVMVSSPEVIETGAIALADIDHDGRIDIIATLHDAFGSARSDIFIFRNLSTAGNIRFSDPIGIGISISPVEIRTGDFDNDNRIDIAATDRLNNKLIIVPNTSSGNNISFGSAVIKSADAPWGLAIGDLNGDGLIDIATTSVSITVTGNSVNVFSNSSAGAISFDDAIDIPLAQNARNLRIADFNGDARPDLGFTYNSISLTDGEFAVIINRNCYKPTLFPAPARSMFCHNSPFTLYTIKTAQATYTWKVDGTDIPDKADSANITVSSGTSVDIEVTITSNDVSCSNTLNKVFAVTRGVPPASPIITNSAGGTICSGGDFTLSGPAGQNLYYWILPDGTELASQVSNNLAITGATSADAGTYGLRVQKGCTSELGMLNVVIDETPAIAIANTGQDNFCENSSAILQVPNYAGFVYQWMDGSGDIPGATLSAYEAVASDDYTVKIINNNTFCSGISAPYTINAITLPVSVLTADSVTCVDAPLNLSAKNSTGQNGFDLAYAWDFGDGTNTTGLNISHAFATESTYNVILTTSYTGINTCEDTDTLSVTVLDVPTIDITVPENSLEKCPNDSIRLELPRNFQSYLWSSGDTTYFTYGKTAPEQDNAIISADMITDLNCPVSSEITIANYANSRIIIESPDAEMLDDTIKLAEGISSITLTARNGSDYVWAPANILDNATTASVKVFPSNRYTTITVTGIDRVNGCETTASVVVEIPNILPRKSFSPNGDNIGYDCWEILNTQDLRECTIYIMDERGVDVFKGNSPFNNNCVWNGNVDNGSSPAPEGIYYFILKCKNSDFNQTGSILLAR